MPTTAASKTGLLRLSTTLSERPTTLAYKEHRDKRQRLAGSATIRSLIPFYYAERYAKKKKNLTKNSYIGSFLKKLARFLLVTDG